MALSSLCFHTYVHLCNFVCVSVLICTENYGACGFVSNYAVWTQLELYNPGMCIPVMGYIDAIGCNCIFDFEYGFTIL